MDEQHLEGLIAAPPTPMTRDGAVDLDKIDELHRLLAANGVRGAFVCGTTGESLSLSVPERMAVAERWAAAQNEGFALIIHVGHESLPHACELAAHAQRIGARAIGLMPPTFFKPRSIDDVVTWCAQVAAAAPDVALYYYHIPSMTGVDISVADFLEAASNRVPTLAGAKFTGADLLDYGRCLDLQGGRFNMLFGRDEFLLAGLSLGARGAVGATFNFAAPLYLRIMDAFRSGDMAAAQADQSLARQLLHIMYRFEGMAAIKPFMKLIGVDCGPPRLPLRVLDASAVGQLRRELDELGFFDFCCRAPE